MSEFYKRTATGIVLVGVIVSSVMLGQLTLLILCGIINLLGLIEFYRLMNVSKKLAAAGAILSISLLSTVFLYTDNEFEWRILLINLPLVSLIFTTVLFLKADNPFYALGSVFIGQIYITIPMILLYRCAFALDDDSFNKNIILGYFFFLWGNDTGAYVFGSLFGRHQLAPSISPKKTWEGSAGGALVVAGIAFANYYFFEGLSLIQWIMLGFIILVMGTLGDLIKSVLKRIRNVKDSGNILPGHGGILDRFDSLIGSAPLVYVYLSILP